MILVTWKLSQPIMFQVRFRETREVSGWFPAALTLTYHRVHKNYQEIKVAQDISYSSSSRSNVMAHLSLVHTGGPW